MMCYALSTSNNDYDPFDQFKSWKEFDDLMGYHSCEYLARVAHVSNSLSEVEVQEEIERAIDDIIRYNGVLSYEPPVFYIKVKKEIN